MSLNLPTYLPTCLPTSRKVFPNYSDDDAPRDINRVGRMEAQLVWQWNDEEGGFRVQAIGVGRSLVLLLEYPLTYLPTSRWSCAAGRPLTPRTP